MSIIAALLVFILCASSDVLRDSQAYLSLMSQALARHCTCSTSSRPAGYPLVACPKVDATLVVPNGRPSGHTIQIEHHPSIDSYTYPAEVCAADGA